MTGLSFPIAPAETFFRVVYANPKAEIAGSAQIAFTLVVKGTESMVLEDDQQTLEFVNRFSTGNLDILRIKKLVRTFGELRQYELPVLGDFGADSGPVNRDSAVFVEKSGTGWKATATFLADPAINLRKTYVFTISSEGVLDILSQQSTADRGYE